MMVTERVAAAATMLSVDIKGEAVSQMLFFNPEARPTAELKKRGTIHDNGSWHLPQQMLQDVNLRAHDSGVNRFSERTNEDDNRNLSCGKLEMG